MAGGFNHQRALLGLIADILGRSGVRADQLVQTPEGEAPASLLEVVTVLSRMPPADPSKPQTHPLVAVLGKAAAQTTDRHEAHLLQTSISQLVQSWTVAPPPAASRAPLYVMMLALLGGMMWLFVTTAEEPDAGEKAGLPARLRAPPPPPGWWGLEVEAFDYAKRRARFIVLSLEGEGALASWAYGEADSVVGDTRRRSSARAIFADPALVRWGGDPAVRGLICIGLASMEGGEAEEEARASARGLSCRAALGAALSKGRRLSVDPIGKFEPDDPDDPRLKARVPSGRAPTPTETAYQRPLLLLAELDAEPGVDRAFAVADALRDPRVVKRLGFRCDDYSSCKLR